MNLKYILKKHVRKIITRFKNIKIYKNDDEYLSWIINNEKSRYTTLQLRKEILFGVYSCNKTSHQYNLIKSLDSQIYKNYEIIKLDKEINDKIDFVLIADSSCILSDFALVEIKKYIFKNNNLNVIYCDSDYLDINDKKRINPVFKPDFSIDMINVTNYIGNLIILKKDIFKKLLNTYSNFQNLNMYDIIKFSVDNKEHVGHIAKVLYHDTIKNDLYKEYKENYMIYYDQKIKIINKENPLISIIIPNMDNIDILKRCVDSVLESTYHNIEIIIVENNSKNATTFEYYKKIEKNNKIKVITYLTNEFNFSNLVNFGVLNCKGKYVILLNNDIEIITKNWIENMLVYSIREDVGAVGVKLLFPDNTIQHAGVVLGINGLAGHILRGIPDSKIYENQYFNVVRNVSAITAACIMINKEKYNAVLGFDKKFAVDFNDVDFCMKLIDKNLLNVYNPNVILYHYESKTRGETSKKKENMKRFKKEYRLFTSKWIEKIYNGDPYYNKNLKLDTDGVEIDIRKH